MPDAARSYRWRYNHRQRAARPQRVPCAVQLHLPGLREPGGHRGTSLDVRARGGDHRGPHDRALRAVPRHLDVGRLVTSPAAARRNSSGRSSPGSSPGCSTAATSRRPSGSDASCGSATPGAPWSAASRGRAPAEVVTVHLRCSREWRDVVVVDVVDGRPGSWRVRTRWLLDRDEVRPICVTDLARQHDLR